MTDIAQQKRSQGLALLYDVVLSWNCSNPTEEDYNWLVDCLHGEDKDIYVADFSEQSAYSCRILVPGLLEIYPVEDLEWENNSVGNSLRPKLLRLNELSEDECADGRVADHERQRRAVAVGNPRLCHSARHTMEAVATRGSRARQIPGITILSLVYTVALLRQRHLRLRVCCKIMHPCARCFLRPHRGHNHARIKKTKPGDAD